MSQEELKKVIFKESFEGAKLRMVTFCGLPSCGKTVAIKRLKLFGDKSETISEQASSKSPEISDDFSLYELHLYATGKHEIKWDPFDTTFGYLFSISSSLKKYCEKEGKQLSFSRESQKQLYFGEGNEVLDSCFNDIHRLLSSWYPIDPKQGTSVLQNFNVSSKFFVNVWDIGRNSAVLHFLTVLAGYLDRNLPVICLRYPDDSDKLKNLVDCKREADNSKKRNIEPIVQHFTRETYLLQFSSLARSIHDAGKLEDQRRKNVCMLTVLVDREKKPYNDQCREISDQISHALSEEMKRHKAGSLFCEEPQIFDPYSPDDVVAFKEKGIYKLLNNDSEEPDSIPLSWIFLRLAFFKSGKLYIKTKELEGYAGKCDIQKDSFKEFLHLFAGFGSIIHIPDIPVFCDYVILNPVDFFHKLNELFYPRFNDILENGIASKATLQRMFGGDEPFFYDVLTSCTFGIEIDSEKIEYPNIERFLPISGKCLFLPGIRSGNTRKKEKDQLSGKNSTSTDNLVDPQSDSLFIKYTTALLPTHIAANMTKYLFQQKLCDLSLVMCKYYNVIKFHYREKQVGEGKQGTPEEQVTPGKVEITVVSHGSVNELRMKGDEDKVTHIKKAIIRAYKHAISEYMERHKCLFGFDASLEFALKCHGDAKVFYHPLNSDKHCLCQMKENYRHLRELWSECLQEVGKEMQDKQK